MIDPGEIDKEELWALCLSMKPDYRPEAFEQHWVEFCALKARASELKAQGVAIHPSFGNISHLATKLPKPTP